MNYFFVGIALTCKNLGLSVVEKWRPEAGENNIDAKILFILFIFFPFL